MSRVPFTPGNLLRDRLWNLFQSLGIEPAWNVYYAAIDSVSGVRSHANFRPQQQLGHFILCGGIWEAAANAGELDPSLQIVSGARRYLGDGLVPFTALLVDDPATSELVSFPDWPAPIVVEPGAPVDFAVEGAGNTSKTTALFEGYHVSPGLARAIKASGELWAGSVTLAPTTSKPEDRRELRFQTAVNVHRWQLEASESTACDLDITIGKERLAPLRFGSVLGGPHDAQAPLARVDKFLPAMQPLTVAARLRSTDAATMRASFYGSTIYAA